MALGKKFLHCTTLAILSMYFTSSAGATSIVNLDDVPHNVTLMVGGTEQTISLMPYQRWRSNAYPIKVIYAEETGPTLEPTGKYAIWKGGRLSLQRKSRRASR